jgi:hypothetical protein
MPVQFLLSRSSISPADRVEVCLCFIGFRKRESVQLRLLLGVCMAELGLLSGCGGGSSGSVSFGPSPVISMVTIRATSESIAHSATFSLTVD